MPPIYVGSDKVSELYVGGSKIKEVYVGSHKVFSSGGGNVVHIGDNDYPFVKIGNLLWITDNLKENISDSEEMIVSGVNFSELYGLGRFYSWNSVCKSNNTASDELSKILPNGWRVPTNSDLDDLISFTSSRYNSRVLKSLETWNSGSHTDDFGFNFKAGGCKYYGSWGDFAGAGYIWSSTKDSTNDAYCESFDTANVIYRRVQPKATSYFSVRLVKDA